MSVDHPQPTEPESFPQRLVELWSKNELLSKVAVLSPSQQTLTFGELADAIGSASSTPQTKLILFSRSLAGVRSYIASMAEPGATILVDDGISEYDLRDLLDRFSVDVIDGPRHTLEKMNFDVSSCDSDWVSLTVSLGRQTGDSSSTLLLGTSGSTGNKKFVRLSSKAVFTNALDISIGLGITDEDIGATVLPLSYSYGLSVLNSMFVAGASVLTHDFDILDRGFRSQLEDNGVTHVAGVPSSYEIYDRLGLISAPPKSARTFTQAGGKMLPKDVRKVAQTLAEHQVAFFPMYGQTEATARMSILDTSLAADYPDSVGSPVRSGSFQIGSDSHSDEIVFRGPNVMLGYASERQRDYSEDSNSGLLFTGDLGEIRDGLLYIHGRAKRIIKVSGRRWDLDDLENLLSRFCKCALVSYEETVVVILAASRQDTEESVVDALKNLGLARRDFVIRHIERLIYTDSGKLDYHTMKEISIN